MQPNSRHRERRQSGQTMATMAAIIVGCLGVHVYEGRCPRSVTHVVLAPA